jgi:hypothetical protein
VPKRLKGVKQNDIHFTPQPSVLKTVVEDEQLRFKFLDGNPRHGGAVGVLKMGDIRQIFVENESLVVETVASAISPAQERDPDASVPIPAGHPLDHWGFAGSTESEVSDRDDRNSGSVDLFPTPVEGEVPGGDNHPVGDRGEAKPRAGKPGGRARGPAANEPFESFAIERVHTQTPMARMMALAISSVPTADGSLRSAFMS